MLINNLRMQKKLMIAPISVIVFLIVLALVSYRGLSNQKVVISELFQVRFKTYQDASQLIYQMTNLHKDLFKLVGFSAAGAEASKTETSGKDLQRSIQKIKSLAGNAAGDSSLITLEKDLYGKFLKEIEAYEGMVAKVIQMATSDGSVALTMMTPVETAFQALNKTLQTMLEYEQQLSQEKFTTSLESFGLIMKVFVAVLVIAVCFSLLISIGMSKLITSPIHKTMEVIKRIAEGDLTHAVAVHSKDEVGELAQSVNAMRLKMGDAVGQSVAMSRSLSEAASRQAASLEETSSSLEEMASMTRRNAENATHSNTLMSSTREVIEKADGSMNEMTASMLEIAKATEETQKIVKTIDEIAFQTNLLALNAAVEAARAGEAGAGFAVVAGEVRNLAMRAADAAKNTSGLMEDIVRKVGVGDRLVGTTNEAFKGITSSSLQVVNLIGEIAAATQEQSQGIEQVNKAVSDMSSVTQQNAAAAEELASIMAMFKTEGNVELRGPKESRTMALVSKR